MEHRTQLAITDAGPGARTTARPDPGSHAPARTRVARAIVLASIAGGVAGGCGAGEEVRPVRTDEGSACEQRGDCEVDRLEPCDGPACRFDGAVSGSGGGGASTGAGPIQTSAANGSGGASTTANGSGGAGAASTSGSGGAGASTASASGGAGGTASATSASAGGGDGGSTGGAGGGASSANGGCSTGGCDTGAAAGAGGSAGGGCDGNGCEACDGGGCEEDCGDDDCDEEEEDEEEGCGAACDGSTGSGSPSSCLVTRSKGFWKNHVCVIEGLATGTPLVPITLGAATDLPTAAAVVAYLGAPAGGDKQVILGRQLAAAKLNAAVFAIGGLPFADLDADGTPESVSSLIALGDLRFDAGTDAERVLVAGVLDALNNAAPGSPLWFDTKCEDPPTAPPACVE